MKNKADLVRGWLRKARSDMLAMAGSRDAGALDACCFHAQQAAEKFLKAYLVYADLEFPFTHNLVKLVELAAASEEAFAALRRHAEVLTPYAVELRYDHEFWPSAETAEEACGSAAATRDLILTLLGPDLAGAGRE